MGRMGRPSIFMEKDRRYRVQAAAMTRVGSEGFEAARKRLARIAGVKASTVSDADTLEYFARGDEATRAYIEARPTT